MTKRCEHPQKDYVYKVTAAGRRYYEQCQACGYVLPNQVGLKMLRNFVAEADVPPIDEAAHERGRRAMWDADNAEWKERYKEVAAERREEASDYYASAAWKKRRQAVLARDKFKCQACLQANAWDVHHLTYVRFGREPLFDLVSICRPCHEDLHPHMKVEPVYEWDE